MHRYPADAYPVASADHKIQVHLDEFVSRNNRRGNPQAAFQTLLGLGARHAPAPLAVVRGASDLPQFPIRP